MTDKMLSAKIITIRTEDDYTFDAYKFRNGLIMIGTDEFLENTTELQQWDGSTVVSIEETVEKASFTEKELLELFMATLNDQGAYNVPIKHFLSLLLLEHS